MSSLSVNRRPLGASGIQVAPLALGGNVFGWTADEETSFKVLDAFIDRGFNLVDTANVYSAWAPGHQGGESETIIGRWFKKSGKRAKTILATKVGMQMGDKTQGLSKGNILRSVEDSLKRLQTDHIDLYQSHKDDPEVPLEETLQAYDTLIKQGKVRAIGASNYTAGRLAQALETSQLHKLPAYVTLQPEYNLYDREGFEKELEPFCLKHGIGVIGYYALASGFLTGKYRSQADLGKSVRGQGIGKKYLNDRGMKILAALDEVASAQQTTLTSIALAWLIQRRSVTAPIVSATSVDQLEQVMQSVDVQLTPEQVKKLDDASAWS
jgi:aryl-alcohol dehydrogenase-like predicted oxidoreductase